MKSLFLRLNLKTFIMKEIDFVKERCEKEAKEKGFVSYSAMITHDYRLLSMKEKLIRIERDFPTLSNECHTAYNAIDALMEKIKSLPK